MQRIVQVLATVNQRICQLCAAAVTIFLAAIAIILFVAVMSRYFLNSAITWAEDATCFLLVWMVLAGSIVAMRQRAHVAIDMLILKFPQGLRNVFRALGTLAVLYVCWFMFSNGIPFTQMGMQRIIPSMDWLKFGYAYLAIPVGFFFMGLICLELFLNDLAGLRRSERKV
jgi:TRAP-type C4-dicarboxylate transport system permease small subunit